MTTKLHLVYLLLFSFIASTPLSAFAENSEKNHAQQIKALKEQIKRVTNKLRSKQKKHRKLYKKLQEFDGEIAGISKSIREIKKKKKRQNTNLTQLKADKKRLSILRAENEDSLKQLTKTLYLLGDQNRFKVFLNQEDPSKFDRMNVYYEYINRAFEKKHNELNEQKSILQALEVEITTQIKQYDELLESLGKENASLLSSKKERKKYLKKLDKQIKSKKRKISLLKSNQKKLEKLTQAIRKFNKKRKTNKSSGIAFAKKKGKLNWPIQGKVIHRYGKPRVGGNLKSRGVLIAADEGNLVKAVNSGEVVFADWLSGYGFVLIVDHGDDYMSLYGHNRQILKDVGDTVKPGDVVAEVGNSGRNGEPALYFEIRYKGKPVNPNKWFVARNSRR